MKKMFTLFVALISFSALFAQYDRGHNTGNTGYNNGTAVYTNNNGNAGNNRGYSNNDSYNRPDAGGNMHRNDGGFDRRGEGRDDNHGGDMWGRGRDNDHRDGGYRNAPHADVYYGGPDYDRMHRERNVRARNIGGAVLLGGILGVVIGSHL